MKARFCDECKHHVAEEAVFTDGRWTTCVLTCTLGHKPRFFKPGYINDSRWGWKRACADFEQREKARRSAQSPSAHGSFVGGMDCTCSRRIMREILDSGVTAQAVGEMGQENQTIRERVKRLEYEVKRLAARNNILEAQNAGLRIQLDEIKKAGRAYYEPSEKKTKDRSCKMVELIIQVLKVPMSMSQIAKHLKVSPQLVRYHLKRNPGIFTVAYNRASSGRTGAVNFWKVKDEYHKN